jgi:hypothetical protein
VDPAAFVPVADRVGSIRSRATSSQILRSIPRRTSRCIPRS